MPILVIQLPVISTDVQFHVRSTVGPGNFLFVQQQALIVAFLSLYHLLTPGKMTSLKIPQMKLLNEIGYSTLKSGNVIKISKKT